MCINADQTVLPWKPQGCGDSLCGVGRERVQIGSVLLTTTTPVLFASENTTSGSSALSTADSDRHLIQREVGPVYWMGQWAERLELP